MKSSAVCFSGHRPYRLPQNKEDIDNLKIKLYRAVDKAVNEGYLTFYQGGCIGFDLLCAMAVITRKKRKKETDKGEIRLIAALPFKNQAEKWSKKDKEIYEEILSYCDEIIFLSENYNKGCYHIRNRYMVDNSDKLICYFDGSSGGTKYTVEYAEEKGLEIENLF
ncbi:MAG: DUF1273 family protein [Oscillospiraceae bacterium]|nr:DUF1273 family protein [Oscillospiraceae bacterium]